MASESRTWAAILLPCPRRVRAAGFVAEVEDNGVWRRVEDATYHATCWVKGRRCVAGEHRFGGIVVQAVDG